MYQIDPLEGGAAPMRGLFRRRPRPGGGIAGALADHVPGAPMPLGGAGGLEGGPMPIGGGGMFDAPLKGNPASTTEPIRNPGSLVDLGGGGRMMPPMGGGGPADRPMPLAQPRPAVPMGGIGLRRRTSPLAGALGMKPKPRIRMGGPAY